MNKQRGPYKKLSQKVQWTVSHDPRREVILCFYEKQNTNVDWNNVEFYVKEHTGRYWLEQIDGRQAIFIRMESGTRIQNTARKKAERKELATVTGAAYPSLALTQKVRKALLKAKQCQFYDLLLKGILDSKQNGYTIYIVSEEKSVSEPKSPIYVGQTRQLLERRWAGHKNADYLGFVDYARYRHENSANWSVHYLSFEECRSFAIEGQLTPDLKNNQEARQSLDEKYSKDPEWGLDQAETALITYCRPHFNKSLNMYPGPLQYTDYCQKQCPVCRPTPK